MTHMWLSLFFVIICINLYTFFLLHRRYELAPRNHRIALFVLGASCIAVTMYFSFEPVPGYLLDLSQLPIVLGSLYGGPVVGTALVLFMLACRILIGGEGLFDSFMLYTSILPLLILIPKKLRTLRPLLRVTIVSFFVYLIAVPSATGILFNAGLSDTFKTEHALLIYTYLLIQPIACAICMSLVETFRYAFRIQGEMQKFEKYHAMAEIAATFAHELRNPLTSIQGFLKLMREAPDLDIAKRDSYMDVMREELERSKFVIDNYITFSRQEPEEVKQVCIHKLLDSVLNALTPIAQMNGVHTVKHFSDKPVYVRAEAGKLSQAFLNVAKNAFESMDAGGTLTISTSTRQTSAVISFEDTGLGMDETVLNRTGTAYYSTKEKGTGLGLFVCHQVIYSLGGTFDIHSRPGKGTRVEVVIPLGGLTVT